MYAALGYDRSYTNEMMGAARMADTFEITEHSRDAKYMSRNGVVAIHSGLTKEEAIELVRFIRACGRFASLTNADHVTGEIATEILNG